jgi:predicted 2-oxoglutarate/Fe(II)-dependent dioxygenase YbiX
MIFQFPDALDRSVCRELCDIYDRHARRAEMLDYSGFPVLHWYDFPDAPEVRDLLRPLIHATHRRIGESLPQLGTIHPETLFLAQLGPGGCHPRHADNSQQDADGSWVPNHTPQRDVSALYYLNGDFSGGEIVFEQHGLVIKPQEGLLVIFPSDRDHVHEVRRVAAGRRYSIQMWFTTQGDFAMELE